MSGTMSSPNNPRRKSGAPNIESAIVVPHTSGELAADIRAYIEAARLRVAQTVNAELVLLNWQIGNRIVSTLSRQLTTEYGAGFSRQNLFHMMRFVEAWPDQTQVTALAQHLG